MKESTFKRPAFVRDHRNKTTAPPINIGPNHRTFDDNHFDKPTTICVTIGSSPPASPENRSDIRGTTYTVKKVTMQPDAKSRNSGYARAPRILRRKATLRRM